MIINNKMIRYIVAIMTILIITMLWYSSVSGEKQNQQFLVEQNSYEKALSLINEGQYENALPIMKEVVLAQPNSSIVKYNYGVLLANLGEWEGASNSLLQSLELDPYQVENASFMFLLANTLVHAGKNAEAEIVLQRCLSLPVPTEMPEFHDNVNNLLLQISGNK